MSLIRLATAKDAEGILNIYGPYVQNTSFTFETDLPSVSDLAKRINDYLKNWPWLVCEINGRIAGYAYGGKYRERTAYQWCVESSIYIHDAFQKAGVGRALYTALIEIFRRQGFRNVYAVINLPNEKSVAFHESLGFEYFATYEKVGYKLGKWKNVGWWRLSVNDYGDEPAAPIKFLELNKDFLQGLFSEKSKLIRLGP
jgi:L-amino acid N-acyltransferase YncA